MTCPGLTPFARGPQSLDLDELERDFLIDRVRRTMQPGERARFDLCAHEPPLALPVAFTITADAWLVQAWHRGARLYFQRARYGADGKLLEPVFPDDLLVSPIQTDPARNGRRGYPCDWPVIADARSGSGVDVEVWLPPGLDAREVAVSIYGIGYAEPAWSGVATKHPNNMFGEPFRSCTSARSPRR